MKPPHQFRAPLSLAFAACFLVACEKPSPRLSMKAGEVDFNRDIRPIFSQHCTSCHGGVKAASGLSFVYREKVLAKGKSGLPIIVPGKPAESNLIHLVTSTDPEEVMPKPDHGPRLEPAQIDMLRRWIEQGAKWSEHWAFEPPQDYTPPKLRLSSWPAMPMDAWVLAQLEAQGMSPSQPAKPSEWLRRATFDLIGLPPSIAEFEAFNAECQSDAQRARERVVDRLLKSPHFGERWAAVWLDLARYADTYGYEKDPHRDVWPWRDWVIRAFNADLPFDQFTVKQLAGDLLPDRAPDDLLATAFHRNTQCNTEGGTDDEEFRTAAVLDRVRTTWTAWQAMTFGCAQCHAHPYDPFPQRDFYRFAAFFNNTEDADLLDDFPRLPLPRSGEPTREWMQQIEAEAELSASLNDEGVTLARALDTDWQTWTPIAASSTAGSLKVLPNSRVEVAGTLPVDVAYTLTMPAVKGLTAMRLHIHAESDRAAVLSQLALHLVTPDGKRTEVKLLDVIADFLAGPFDPKSSLRSNEDGFGEFPTLTRDRWCVVLLDAPLIVSEGAKLELRMEHFAKGSGLQAVPVRHFTWSVSDDPRWITLAREKSRKQKRAELVKLHETINREAGPLVPIMRERCPEAKRATHVFVRGNRLVLGDAVSTGLPAISAPQQKEGLTRLELARWLVSEENTLTARVLANRCWAELFGRGIVSTLEDFGSSGSLPTHPELLDHLALRLRDTHRWSLKGFLRELALSATYAQSSVMHATDMENLLLTHGPHVRLTAEMVRDQALVLSGLFSDKLYGPPIYPPQPDSVWKNVYNGSKWMTSTGPDRYRRALYVYHKRTSAYPGLLTFDAPARDACIARRIATNTPLQALLSMNDPAMIEMAEAMAERMTKHAVTTREQVRFGCQLLTLEAPPETMVATLMKLHDNALREPNTDAKTAMLLVANTLLNTDAAMTR